MKITCSDNQSDLKISSRCAELLIETFLEFKNVKTDEVFVHFIDQSAICKLHEEYFDDPTPTDCISFPIDAPGLQGSGHHILGEIFICPKTAIEYGNSHQTSPYLELSLYLVHGLLHLLGYDDLEDEDEKIMREEEKKCMKILREKEALFLYEDVY